MSLCVSLSLSHTHAHTHTHFTDSLSTLSTLSLSLCDCARSRDEAAFFVLVAAEQALLEMYAEHLGLPMPLALDSKAKRLSENGAPH